MSLLYFFWCFKHLFKINDPRMIKELEYCDLLPECCVLFVREPQLVNDFNGNTLPCSSVLTWRKNEHYLLGRISAYTCTSKYCTKLPRAKYFFRKYLIHLTYILQKKWEIKIDIISLSYHFCFNFRFHCCPDRYCGWRLFDGSKGSSEGPTAGRGVMRRSRSIPEGSFSTSERAF